MTKEDILEAIAERLGKKPRDIDICLEIWPLDDGQRVVVGAEVFDGEGRFLAVER